MESVAELRKTSRTISALIRPARGAYRAKPVRRCIYRRPIAKTARSSGAGTKSFQRAAVEVLNAIYETDFLGFSYGRVWAEPAQAWTVYTENPRKSVVDSVQTLRPPHAGRFCLPAPEIPTVFAAHRPSVYTPYALASLGTLLASALWERSWRFPRGSRRSSATSLHPTGRGFLLQN